MNRVIVVKRVQRVQVIQPRSLVVSVSTLPQGPSGPPGSNGSPGPNLLSSSTTVGTLTGLTGSYSLLGLNAAGNAVGQLSLSATVRSLLGAPTAQDARTAIGVVPSAWPVPPNFQQFGLWLDDGFVTSGSVITGWSSDSLSSPSASIAADGVPFVTDGSGRRWARFSGLNEMNLVAFPGNGTFVWVWVVFSTTASSEGTLMQIGDWGSFRLYPVAGGRTGIQLRADALGEVNLPQTMSPGTHVLGYRLCQSSGLGSPSTEVWVDGVRELPGNEFSVGPISVSFGNGADYGALVNTDIAAICSYGLNYDSRSQTDRVGYQLASSYGGLWTGNQDTVLVTGMNTNITGVMVGDSGQLLAADLSGLTYNPSSNILAVANLNASVLTSGTIPAARLPIAAAGTLGGVRVGTGLSIDGSGILSASGGMSIGGSITGATAGRILFTGSGPVLAESSLLRWDQTNTRMGVGVASPQHVFHVVSPSGSNAEFFLDSGGTGTIPIFRLARNGTPLWTFYCNSSNQFSVGRFGAGDALNITQGDEVAFRLSPYSMTGTGSYQTTRYGRAAAPNVTPGSGANTVIGEEAGSSLTTGAGNTLIGLQAGTTLSTGVDNTIIGSQSGVPAGGSSHSVFGRSNNVSALSRCAVFGIANTAAHDESIVFGAFGTTTKSGQFLTGRFTQFWTMQALTSVQDRPVCEIQRSLINTTDASYTGRMVQGTYRMVSGTPTFQEGLRIDADAGGVRTSVNGVSAVARQTASAVATDLATALTLVNNLRTILINFGVAQ